MTKALYNYHDHEENVQYAFAIQKVVNREAFATMHAMIMDDDVLALNAVEGEGLNVDEAIEALATMQAALKKARDGARKQTLQSSDFQEY